MKTHNNQDRRFWVSPGQENHEAYRLPPEVVHLNRPGLPLYQAVAYWGEAIGTFFTRHDLSEAFGVPLRRASNVMDYLTHERKECVQCEVNYLTRQMALMLFPDVPFKGRCLLQLRIIRVEPDAFGQRGAKSSIPPSRARKTAHSLRDKPCGAATLLFRLCHSPREGEE